MSAPDVGVIIVAGGSGSRTSSKELKQFRWVYGKPMLLHSVQAFQARPGVAMVVCVLPKAYVGDPPPWLFQSDIERLLLSVGGRERQESVYNGLGDLPPDVEIVVVHDAARPLASPALFAAVVAAVTGGGADGAVPGVPPSDTIKAVDESGRVTDTFDRARLVAVQTPQAFRAALLRHAHAAVSTGGATDDAMLVEALGGTVLVVPGEPANLKITDPGDLGTAERLLAQREA